MPIFTWSSERCFLEVIYFPKARSQIMLCVPFALWAGTGFMIQKTNVYYINFEFCENLSLLHGYTKKSRWL